MKNTFRAMQISAAGELELVERPVPTPGPGQVLIAVEACGICGADANDIERFDPKVEPPRIPGTKSSDAWWRWAPASLRRGNSASASASDVSAAPATNAAPAGKGCFSFVRNRTSSAPPVMAAMPR